MILYSFLERLSNDLVSRWRPTYVSVLKFDWKTFMKLYLASSVMRNEKQLKLSDALTTVFSNDCCCLARKCFHLKPSCMLPNLGHETNSFFRFRYWRLMSLGPKGCYWLVAWGRSIVESSLTRWIIHLEYCAGKARLGTSEWGLLVTLGRCIRAWSTLIIWNWLKN